MKINYDLKKSPTTKAKTLEHCLAVIDRYINDSGNTIGSQAGWNKAVEYLKRYIDELFLQNK